MTQNEKSEFVNRQLIKIYLKSSQLSVLIFLTKNYRR